MKNIVLTLCLSLLLLVMVGCVQQPPVQTSQSQAETITTQAAIPTDTPIVLTSPEPQTSPTLPPPTVLPTVTPAPNATIPITTTKSRLQIVKERGVLRCGISETAPGFGSEEESGSYRGFDVDFCRVVAVAVLGDPQAVAFVAPPMVKRFEAVRNGDIDVLFRKVTWTFERDTVEGLDFGPVIFYDSQGVMTRFEVDTVEDLDDVETATICVLSSTTSEATLQDYLRANNVDYDVLLFDEVSSMYQAYEDGRCDAVTHDYTSLVVRRALLENPEEHSLLNLEFVKDPLAPVIASGDSQWRDVVTWSIYVTMQAEEFGISSANVDQFYEDERPAIRRFLGLEGSFGADLGVRSDFALAIIQTVGNYAEIYDRNLGPQTPYDIERGLNALWIDGGLLYPPPFQ